MFGCYSSFLIDLWVEKVLVKTQKQFPDTHRRMEVIDQTSGIPQF